MLAPRDRLRSLAGLGLAIVMGLAPALAERPAPAQDAGPSLLAGQPVAEYQRRRAELRKKAGDGQIVVFGARSADFTEFVKFRQNNDFQYLTGVEAPNAILLMTPAGDGEKGHTIVFLPDRNPSEESWAGPKDGPGPESVAKFGVDEVVSSPKFFARLIDLLSEAGGGEGGGRRRGARGQSKLYTQTDRSGSRLSREADFAETLRRVAPQAQPTEVAPFVAELRKIKSTAEVALLQKAIDITLEAQRDAAAAIRPRAYEYEAQAALEAAFTRNGAQRPGFFSIVGSGPNSCVLHYNDNRRKMEEGDLVVVDIGAEYDYYTADVTRTFPVSGKFTPRQREIYQLVLDAQKAAEAAFKPGESTLAQLQRVAAETMRNSPLRDAQGNALDRYFRHGLSHWLGMDVHDVGDYGPPIPVGSVFTIEPGIYLPDEDLGVRIEDDYLVTETGLVKLSGALPSQPDEIERMMGVDPASSRRGSAQPAASNP